MTANTKDCIWCGEEIKAGAKICRFCSKEQVAPQEERVLYEGLGNLPLQTLILDALLCFVLIGFVTGLMHYLEYSSRKYRITTKRVDIESGRVSKKIDTLELYRVQDLRFQSSWGKGTIVLVSTDRTSPRLLLPIPTAQQVFPELQEAVERARKEQGVVVREGM